MATELLDLISRQFLCSYPLRNISWTNVFPLLNWDLQTKLVQTTVNFEPNLKYPLKTSYQKAFLKFIIDELNKLEIEICDDLYNAYGLLVAKPDEQFCYKHFPLGIKVVSIRENVCIISEGTTGLSTWQAGVVLAEWCILNKHLLHAQKIVELGSGAGLTGLTVLLMCEPAEIYLTDAHVKVLENLCFNVKLNTQETSDLQIKSDFESTILCRSFNSIKINVLDLPWSLVTSSLRLGARIILAADVVYDSSLFSDLINAIDLLLEEDGLFVLASTERNRSTLETFIGLLEERFDVIEGETPSAKYFCYPSNEKVYIHLIRRKIIVDL